jgi:multisubunit Na+/H+ antiporter MnhF subunit
MMALDLGGPLGLAVAAALAVSGLALLLGFWRLALGPTLADRVVALDLVTMILVVILTLLALGVAEGAYLDAAIALALVAFLATVAFARYLERRLEAHEAAERRERPR